MDGERHPQAKTGKVTNSQECLTLNTRSGGGTGAGGGESGLGPRQNVSIDY